VATVSHADDVVQVYGTMNLDEYRWRRTRRSCGARKRSAVYGLTLTTLSFIPLTDLGCRTGPGSSVGPAGPCNKAAEPDYQANRPWPGS
jgi:hypothetical protein